MYSARPTILRTRIMCSCSPIGYSTLLPRLKPSHSCVDEIWRCLTQEGAETIGISGVPGIGKTTVLRQIRDKLFNTPKSHFDLVIWVEIPENPILEEIQESISRQIGLIDDDDDGDGEGPKNKFLEGKADEIYVVLAKKKFVMLVDNVSAEVANWGMLQRLGACLENGSRLVLTTSSEKARLFLPSKRNFELKALEWRSAWEFFRQRVAEKAPSALDILLNPRILPLARVAVRNCYGLPLALDITAGALARMKTPDEWRRALMVLGVNLFQFKILGIFLLSFQFLPSKKARDCFLCCFMFPKGSKIFKRELIDSCVSETVWFHQVNEDNCVYHDGYQAISALVAASLLEDGGEYVKMHDWIYDVALSLIGNRSYVLVQASAGLRSAPGIDAQIIRCSLMKNSIRHLTRAPRCRNLITLMLSHNPFVEITSGFFQYMDKLTVLDLSYTPILELPSGIPNLVSLQCLNLSHTMVEQLPAELKKLRKLKSLNLESTDLLRMIPRGVISSFSLMQVLGMFRCGFSLAVSEDNILAWNEFLLEELQFLTCLQVLSITITSASSLDVLYKAHRLSSCVTALSLQCLWGSKSLDISMLPNMVNLAVLEIYHTDHLEAFNVDILMGKNLNQLREVRVRKCSHLLDLTWLVLAPNLQILRIKDCAKLEGVVSAGRLNEALQQVVCDKNHHPFQKLEVLSLENLPQLKSICWNALPFPCLKKLRIVDCSRLKKFPLNRERTKGFKLIIQAQKTWWESIQWENNAKKVAFYPPFSFLCLID